VAGGARVLDRTDSGRRYRSPSGWRGGCPDDRNGLTLLARARGLNHDAAARWRPPTRSSRSIPSPKRGTTSARCSLAELGRADESAAALDRYGEYRPALETDLALPRAGGS